MASKAWTDEEHELLKAHYASTPIHELRNTLFPHRTISSIRNRATELGVYKRHPNTYAKLKQWTTAEEQAIIDNYSKLSYRQMPSVLPGRSVSSIIGKIGRMIKDGILDPANRASRKPWTRSADLLLRRSLGAMHIEQVCKRLGRSEGAIMQRAWELGIEKAKTNAEEFTDCMTLSDVQRVFGFGEKANRSETMLRWMGAGMLNATRVPMKGPRPYYRISDNNLCEFLEQNPLAYDVDRMPDVLPNGKKNDYKWYAKEVLRVPEIQARYVTKCEAASYLKVSITTIDNNMKKGRIPYEKTIGTLSTVWILKSDLDKLKPMLRDFKGRRRRKPAAV